MELSLWMTALENSLKLVLGTTTIAVLIGLLTSLAAWRSGCAAGRLLPLLSLAVPPYIFVYCLSEISDYLSPWSASIGVLGLCNSAFIHAPLTSFLSRQGDSIYEAAFVATGSRPRSLLHVLRPALSSALPLGAAIVACEALSDLAVSRYYGIQSLVVMSFTFWSASISLTNIIPGLAFIGVLGLLFSIFGKRFKTVPFAARQRVSRPFYAIMACLPASTVIGFCVGVLMHWMPQARSTSFPQLLGEIGNSGILVAIATLGCSALALLMVVLGVSRHFVRISLFLYGIPALVLAALLLPMSRWLPYLFLLGIAIFLRFSCLMVVNMDSSMQSHQKLQEMLTATCNSKTRLLHQLRLYSPGFVSGICLVSLDVLRELPMSMLLQPFNFTTLAMRVYYLSATEMLSSIAPEAIVLFSISLLVTIILAGVQHAFTA